MNYESWRATFQSSEQAARAAFLELQAARAQGSDKLPQVMGRIYRDVYGREGEPVPHLNSEGRKLPDGTALYAEPVGAQGGEVEHDCIEIADDTPEWIKKYLRETEFQTVEALRAAYHALLTTSPGKPEKEWQPSEKQADRVVRAFWRRIYPYRNRYGKELPKELPVEFGANMATALCAINFGGPQPPQDRRETTPAAKILDVANCRTDFWATAIGGYQPKRGDSLYLMEAPGDE